MRSTYLTATGRIWISQESYTTGNVIPKRISCDLWYTRAVARDVSKLSFLQYDLDEF